MPVAVHSPRTGASSVNSSSENSTRSCQPCVGHLRVHEQMRSIGARWRRPRWLRESWLRNHAAGVIVVAPHQIEPARRGAIWIGPARRTRRQSAPPHRASKLLMPEPRC